MNEVQRANAMLGVLLGEVGRAVWLAVRVDGKCLREVAEELDLPIGRVKSILETSDFAITAAAPAGEQKPVPEYKTAWGGFHQTEDSP